MTWQHLSTIPNPENKKRLLYNRDCSDAPRTYSRRQIPVRNVLYLNLQESRTLELRPLLCQPGNER